MVDMQEALSSLLGGPPTLATQMRRRSGLPASSRCPSRHVRKRALPGRTMVAVDGVVDLPWVHASHGENT